MLSVVVRCTRAFSSRIMERPIQKQMRKPDDMRAYYMSALHRWRDEGRFLIIY